MNVIKRATLEAYWTRHPEVEQPLKTVFQEISRAKWACMNDIKMAFPKAKVLNRERVIFEVCGGNYRLIVAFHFTSNIAFIKFIGTHTEYDRINVLTVGQY